jgi:ATP-dependent Clp protease ATP-binding subunit ClpA
MFERFTEGARQVVVDAQAEARGLRHGWVGTEHLMLAFLRDGSPLAGALTPLGLTYELARQEVATLTAAATSDSDAALRDLGIDVDEVRRRVEASFGPGALADPPREGRWRRVRVSRRRREGKGHIPFTAEAKKALELSLREALQLDSREITASHVVLGVVRAGGQATVVMNRLGVEPAAVRRAVLDGMGRAA